MWFIEFVGFFGSMEWGSVEGHMPSAVGYSINTTNINVPV
jgi:hypothetical protein